MFRQLRICAIFFLAVVQPAASQNLTILHTNDLHAQYLPLKSGKSITGGMEALDALIRRERNGHTILLDAGDFQTGTLVSRLDENGVTGGGMVAMMNLLGVSASVPGNHEFDNGSRNLKAMEAAADFDLLAANLEKDGRPFLEKTHTVVTVGGIRVGIIGLVSGKLDRLVFAEKRGGIEIEDPVTAAGRLVRVLDPMTDLIVLLTHQGFREDSLLAIAVPEADVIVGGHSHTELKRPMRINGVVIAQAGSKSEFLGRLDLEVQNDRVASYSGRLVPVRSAGPSPDHGMHDLVENYRKRIESRYGTVIGRLKAAWTPARNRESNVGDFFADVIRERVGAEIAVINSGGIRKGMPKGSLREMDVYEVYPFDNRLVKFSCSGGQVLQLIRSNAAAAFSGSRGILQVSGLRYRAKKDKLGRIRIAEASVNGGPVLPDRVYSVASVDYLVPTNSKEYFGFEPKSSENLDLFQVDAAIEYIRSHPVIRSRVEGRMKHERSK
jgi:5'-nucleotidase / UDP-sugar diphosphatase